MGHVSDYLDVATMSISSNALKVIPQVPSAGINVDFGATVNNKIYKVECDIDYGTTTSGNNLQVYIYNVNSGSVSNLSSYNIPGSGHYVFYYTAAANQSYLKFAYQGNNPSSNYFLVDNISILDENATTYDHFTGELLSANDYYAFGANMPGRNFSSNNYRYGFNGKENDPESGTQDYGMRIYNPNLGKFLSVDPLTAKYPHYAPYSFAGNKPIAAVDIDGCEENLTFMYKVNGETKYHTVSWTTLHPDEKNGPLGVGTLLYEYNAETKEWGTGVYQQTFAESQPLKATVKDLERGTLVGDGSVALARTYSGTLQGAGKTIRALAIGTALFPGTQELAQPVYKAGEVISMVGDLAEVYVAYKDGNQRKAIVKAATAVLNYVGGKLMEKEFGDKVTDKIGSEFLDYGTGVMSDAMAEPIPMTNTTNTTNVNKPNGQ